MRKFFLATLVAATVAITGCADEFDDGGYSEVADGVSIYNEALISRVFATDGASIAMRLGVLIEELDQEGLEFSDGDTEPDYTKLSKYRLNEKDYDRRELLIGKTSEVSISRDGDEYTITYDNEKDKKHLSANFDFCRRRGGFVVDTNGVDLMDTNYSTPWVVTFADEDGSTAVMTYATAYKYEYGGDVEAKSTSCKIYKDGADGKFIVEGLINARYMGLDEYYPFQVIGSVTISDFIDESTALTSENTLGVSSSVYLATSSSAPHDTISGTSINYETTVPLVYSPSKMGVYSIAGTEQAVFSSALNVGFASTTVNVISNADGSRKINYNGHSYIWEISGANFNW